MTRRYLYLAAFLVALALAGGADRADAKPRITYLNDGEGVTRASFSIGDAATCAVVVRRVRRDGHLGRVLVRFPEATSGTHVIPEPLSRRPRRTFTVRRGATLRVAYDAPDRPAHAIAVLFGAGSGLNLRGGS